MTESAAGNRAGAVLVVVAGQVASGKSTISRALAGRIGAERLEADRVRGTLLAAAAAGPAGAEASWRRDLSPGFEDEIYADLLRRADAVLADGHPLVLDACFPRRAQRDAARALAQRRGVPFLFVECRVDHATLAARLAERDRREADGGWAEIHQRLAAHFEPPSELDPDGARVTVGSDGPTEPAITAILARLAARQVRLPEPLPPAVLTPMPRAVSFDCWNTLIAEEDWTWAHALRVAALIDAAREAGVAVDRADAGAAFDAAWARHQELWVEGRATGAREVAGWALAELGLDAGANVTRHLVHRFEEASHTSHVAALEHAEALLHALSEVGVARVLVCDTGLTPGRVVRRLLERVALLDHLDALAFSDEVGAPKPGARAFLAALEPLDIEAADCVHVGDLRRTDVAGARALGMRTVRIRARYDDASDLPDADHVVASHAELASLLGLRLASDRSTRDRGGARRGAAANPPPGTRGSR